MNGSDTRACGVVSSTCPSHESVFTPLFIEGHCVFRYFDIWPGLNALLVGFACHESFFFFFENLTATWAR